METAVGRDEATGPVLVDSEFTGEDSYAFVYLLEGGSRMVEQGVGLDIPDAEFRIGIAYAEVDAVLFQKIMRGGGGAPGLDCGGNGLSVGGEENDLPGLCGSVNPKSVTPLSLRNPGSAERHKWTDYQNGAMNAARMLSPRRRHVRIGV
jgi:hypothetical protein